MKINSSVFARALDTNVYDFVPGEVKIHSFSQNGCGIIRRSAVSGCQEAMRIVLSRNDADILARFHDDLVLEKTGETIKCSAGASRCSFQNITELAVPRLKMANLQSVNISLAEYKKAAGMAKKEGVQISKNGCASSNTDRSFAYRLFKNLGDIKSISAPVEVLKLLNNDERYSIFANDTFITFQLETEIVYSNLYTKLITALDDFDPKTDGMIRILEPNKFAEHLKYASAFSDLVRLNIENGEMLLTTDVVAQDPRRYSAVIPVNSNFKVYSRAVNIENLLRCIDAIYPKNADEIEIGVSKTILKFRNDTELAATAIVKMLEGEEYELEEEGGSDDGTE